MLGAVTYTLYMEFSETDDKIESKVVCGELTLKQRRANGISRGSENASGNHTDLCDKLTIRTRQAIPTLFADCWALIRIFSPRPNTFK